MKYLLVLGIIIYIAYKVLSFFFRAGAASQQLRNFQEQQRRQTGQEKTTAPKTKKGHGHVNGGDYIDFEEIKK